MSHDELLARLELLEAEARVLQQEASTPSLWRDLHIVIQHLHFARWGLGSGDRLTVNESESV